MRDDFSGLATRESGIRFLFWLLCRPTRLKRPRRLCRNPGVLHTVASGIGGLLGLYRIETQVTTGSSSLRMSGVRSHSDAKEAIEVDSITSGLPRLGLVLQSRPRITTTTFTSSSFKTPMRQNPSRWLRLWSCALVLSASCPFGTNLVRTTKPGGRVQEPGCFRGAKDAVAERRDRRVNDEPRGSDLPGFVRLRQHSQGVTRVSALGGEPRERPLAWAPSVLST